MSHFVPEAWREFLEGGHVRTDHLEPIPIWAGFLIAQNADLREQVAELHTQIGVILMTQAISLHQMFQGDMNQIQTAFTQLVAANTVAKQTAQQMLAQIATLQAKVANPDADPVTANDLSTLNDFAAQIQQAAASTITTGTTDGAPAATPPATTAPASTPASTGTDGTTAAAPAAASDGTSAPATSAPTSTAPATGAVVAGGALTANPSQPIKAVNAGDTGAGA
ncbi:hypothetical protein [Nocardia tengchongensis]|uniref:hypothetical protein n=1 Tax=Nocardia tengchongensis TaxID=2055889 RepID=UPI0036A43AB8